MQGSHTVAAATDRRRSLHPLAKQVVHQDTITRPSENVHKRNALLQSRIFAEQDDPNALAFDAHNLHKASSGKDPERQLWPFVSLEALTKCLSFLSSLVAFPRSNASTLKDTRLRYVPDSRRRFPVKAVLGAQSQCRPLTPTQAASWTKAA